MQLFLSTHCEIFLSFFFLNVMFYDFIYLAKGFRMRPKVRSTLSDSQSVKLNINIVTDLIDLFYMSLLVLLSCPTNWKKQCNMTPVSYIAV